MSQVAAMAPILIQSLVVASAGLLSVGSITIVILLLLSDQGLRNGIAYMSGYVGGYMLIGVSITWVGYTVAENSSGESGRLTSILLVILGGLLLFLAQRNWRKPLSDSNENPRLFSIIDKITPLKAFALGALVTVINFKNLAIYLSALSVSLTSDLALPAKMVIAILVTLIFCAAVIVPVLIYLLFPKRADHLLKRIKRTLETYSRPIGIWIPLLFGLIFLGRGITGLF